MTYYTSPSLFVFSASVTFVLYLATLLVHPTSFLPVLSCYVLLRSFQLSQDGPVYLSSHGHKSVVMSDLVLSASRNIVSLFFFAVHEIGSNRIFVASRLLGKIKAHTNNNDRHTVISKTLNSMKF